MAAFVSGCLWSRILESSPKLYKMKCHLHFNFLYFVTFHMCLPNPAQRFCLNRRNNNANKWQILNELLTSSFSLTCSILVEVSKWVNIYLPRLTDGGMGGLFSNWWHTNNLYFNIENKWHFIITASRATLLSYERKGEYLFAVGHR